MDEQERPIDEMAYRLGEYLAGEKTAAFWHLGLGLPGLFVGMVVLIVAERPFWLGLGWAIVLPSVVQGWTGWQYLREWRRLIRVLPGELQRHPQAFIRLETTRMESLLPYHRRLRMVVLGILIFGIMLTLAGGVAASLPFTLGLGAGCCVQGAVLLVLTLSGHWRNELYSYEVRSFGDKPHVP